MDVAPPPVDAAGDLLAGVPVVNPAALQLAFEWPVHRIGPASRPTTIMVAVRVTGNHSGEVYLALAVRLATPEGCSAGRLCLTHTRFRLAGQRGVGLLVSIAVFTI